ncbi:cytochrome b/b6 domain-containing protein [Escherichia coli]
MQEYNMVQKVAYILIILDGAALLLSGLVLWKPVQFSLLTILFGGYDTARYIHFLCMNIMVLFIIIHLVMVLLVPRALLSMIRGH